MKLIVSSSFPNHAVKEVIGKRIPGLGYLNHEVWSQTDLNNHLQVDTGKKRIGFGCFSPIGNKSKSDIRVFSGLSFEMFDSIDRGRLETLALLIKSTLENAMPLLRSIVNRRALNAYVHEGLLFNECLFVLRRKRNDPETLSLIRQVTERSFAKSFASQVETFRQKCEALTSEYGLFNPGGLVVAAVGYPNETARLLTESYNFAGESLERRNGQLVLNTEKSQSTYTANFAEYRRLEEVDIFDIISQGLTSGTGLESLAAYHGSTLDLKQTPSDETIAWEKQLSDDFQKQADIARRIFVKAENV